MQNYKSKEENSGRSDDLGEFDFSMLDKLGTEKNKTKKKNSTSWYKTKPKY